MDSIEKYALFSGHSYDKNDQGAAHSANVTMITGTAMSDSTDGVVSVDFGGNTISADDEQAVDVSTTCAVKEGDTVQVSVVGADGTAKSLLVTGVIAGGDRMQADIEGAKDTAASADAAATIAKENAAKANELANEAISNANAANTQAREAMNSVNTANGKISALQKNVDTMNSDISTAQDAISKNASDITGINQKLSTDYATKGEVSDVKVAVESEIDTKANALTASVAETYAAKSDVTKITDDLSNRISINEKGISSSSDEIKTLKSDTANISKDVTAAQDAASAAQKTADTAVSNANAAQTAADKAQSTANGASTAAATAQSAADGAKTAASAAQKTANSAKTAADNAKSAADKANSDLAKLTDTVSKQSTKIEQNSGSISSIASRTETVENKFTNYYTKTETNSQIKQTADGINSTVSKKVGKDGVISSINQSAEEVKINANRVAINGTLSVTDAINNAQTAANNAQSAVDNIQVGGRNLLKGTSKEVKEWTIPANNEPYQYPIKIPSSQPIRAEIPYGCEYRASVDVLFPADNTICVDINNAPTSGDAWAGNDNDNREKRVNLNINVRGGIWTRISWGSENSNPRNTSKVNLIVFDYLYLKKAQPTEVKAKWKCMKVEIGNRATDWTPAPEDVQSGIDAAQSTANAANSTANTTKTYFYNDSSGSHVISRNSNSAGTRADVKTDGMHIVDQDDGKELASFTSSGAAIGKDSEIHTKYSTDGIDFYEKNKSYPFTRIYPVSIEKEKYSAASISSAPSDITDSSVMDDGLWHSTGAVSTSAVDGTSTDNNGWARAVLGATTVQSGTSNSASVEVFASNSNPNKGSGGVGGDVDNYINMTADDVFINNSSISHIGELYTKNINYTTKEWAQGSWDGTLKLPAGTYILFSGCDFTDVKNGIYRQFQVVVQSGTASVYPQGLGLYQNANNNSADTFSTVVQIIVAKSSCELRPYVHTYLNDWTIPVSMNALRIR